MPEMETVAVYEERPIKAYALQIQTGFCLLAARLPLSRCQDLDDCLGARPGEWAALFCTVNLAGEAFSYTACLPKQAALALADHLRERGAELVLAPLPVAVVHLQGPHYGDRYGIAAAAAGALAEAGLALLSMSAVVHSIFLAVPAEQGEPALAALAKHFATPKTGTGL